MEYLRSNFLLIHQLQDMNRPNNLKGSNYILQLCMFILLSRDEFDYMSMATLIADEGCLPLVLHSSTLFFF